MLSDVDLMMQAQDPNKLKRLLSAVIIRAISDYVSYKGKQTTKAAKLFDQAREWLFSDAETPSGPGYTFMQACDALSLDVGAVRAKLDTLQEREIERFRRVMSPERTDNPDAPN